MATSRRRTAKKDIGQNIGDLESRVKKVERRPRASIGSYSITSDLIAPGSITLDKLDPTLLKLLQDASDTGAGAGDSSEYLFSGGDDGAGLVTGVVDSVISQYDFSTTSASGKNSIFWQDTEPTGGEYTDGDLWYDTSLDGDGIPKYLAYRYDGATGQWEDAQLGDAAFRFVDAGKISTGILDAGIAIRVGTYPLDSAVVGKSRVEIASSFPMKVNGVDETFSGIQVLRKTDESQTEGGSGFYPTMRINADTGEFRVGGTQQYLSYNADTDKLLLTGKMITGTGNESLAIGTDLTGITVSVTAASISSNVATLTTDAAHGAVIGSAVTVSNVSSTFNGTYTVTAVPSTTQLRYAKTASNISLTGLSGTVFVDGGDGIRLGPYNAWYRPSSIVNGSSPIFKVGSGKTNNAITVTKDGDVTIDGVVNPVAGTVKGRMTVRLEAGNASDKFILGQNLPGLFGVPTDEFDGLSLNQYNYFVLSNNNKQAFLRVGTDTKSLSYDGSTGLLKLVGGDITLTGGGSFKTSDSNTRVEMNSNGIFGYVGGTKTFWVDAATGDSSFEGTTNPTGGTVKGKLTIQGTTYAFGKDVMSVRDGLYLNANNYWTLSQTGATAEFKVGGASKFVQWTGAELNISGNITASTFIGGTFQTATSGNRVIMTDAGSSADQIQFYSEFTDSTPANIRILTSTDGNPYSKFYRSLQISSTTMSPYSPSTISAASITSNVATITTTTAHGAVVGDGIDITGVSATFNGSWTVTAVPTSTTLRFARTATNVSLTGLSGKLFVLGGWMAPTRITMTTGFYSTGASQSTITMTTPKLLVTNDGTVGSHETIIAGDLWVQGDLTVSGTGGGSSGGYDNATDGSETNKITYGGTAPTSGRTAGDIHIEF